MDQHLNQISKAYDATVEEYEQGIDPESLLPENFKNSSEYKEFQNLGGIDSDLPAIKEFLQPDPGMKYLDIGSCANLFKYRLDQWGSIYFGVDVSPKLVEKMSKFAKKNGLSIGGIYVADMSKLPFEENFFDIASVIGVLEYYEIEYIEKALAELFRVLKSDSRVVLDVLNLNHRLTQTMIMAETYKGRSYPSRIPSKEEFEQKLVGKFKIEKIDDSGVMSLYYLSKTAGLC